MICFAKTCLTEVYWIYTIRNWRDQTLERKIWRKIVESEFGIFVSSLTTIFADKANVKIWRRRTINHSDKPRSVYLHIECYTMLSLIPSKPSIRSFLLMIGCRIGHARPCHSVPEQAISTYHHLFAFRGYCFIKLIINIWPVRAHTHSTETKKQKKTNQTNVRKGINTQFLCRNHQICFKYVWSLKHCNAGMSNENCEFRSNSN